MDINTVYIGWVIQGWCGSWIDGQVSIIIIIFHVNIIVFHVNTIKHIMVSIQSNSANQIETMLRLYVLGLQETSQSISTSFGNIG